MKTIEIGMQGKIGKETLTVTEILNGGKMFKCNNGKIYLSSGAFWLTEKKEVKEKTKRLKKPIIEKNEIKLTISEYRKIEAKLEAKTRKQLNLL